MKNDVIVGFGVQGKKRLKFLNKKKNNYRRPLQ